MTGSAGQSSGVVAVIGAGLMGTEIGLEYALGGFVVMLVDRTPEALERSRQRAGDSISFLGGVGLIDPAVGAAALERLSGTTVIEEAVEPADIVVEAVDEDFELKAGVLGTIARISDTATIATNTSALSVTALGDASGAPDRVLGTHYMNPPTLMPIVEVVPGRDTTPSRTQRMLDILRRLGKEAILIPDVPGFITNRLQLALLREAAALVDEGVASPETIDVVARKGFGRRWSLAGPFESMAAGGPKTLARVADEVFPHLASATDGSALRRITLPSSSNLQAAIDRRNLGFASVAPRGPRAIHLEARPFDLGVG